MTRPVPAHGTYARARGVRPTATNPGRPPCDCQHCTKAERRYDKALRVKHSRGQRGLVDAEPVREKLRQLRGAGASWKEISAATGIHENRAIQILINDVRQVRSSTAQAILGIRDVEAVTGRSHLVPSVGTNRRIKALMAIGHSAVSISRAAGIGPQQLSEILNGHHECVERATHDAVCGAYRQMWNVVGTSARSRCRAQREGWAGPLCWNDDSIDDPGAYPDWTGHCGSPSGWLLHHAWEQEPCGACAGHAVDLTSRPHVRQLVVTYSGALDALTADGWTWTRIGALVHAKPGFVRDQYSLHVRSDMGVAA